MQLSLDCLSLTDTSPAELITSAAGAGFDFVSVWTNPPSAFPRALLQPAMERECAALLADTGVGVHSIEVFDLTSEEAVLSYRPALELGARLGGKAALVVHNGNPDRSEAIACLGLFADVAGECGLGVILEPIAMGFTRTLAEASLLIREAGVNAGILMDTYHLVRTGGGVDDLRAVEPGLIRYVQINDGPLLIPPDAMIAEAMGERLYPGEGAFPLEKLLSAVPGDIPWAIEVPSLRRAQARVTPDEQAVEAMAALQAVLRAMGR